MSAHEGVRAVVFDISGTIMDFGSRGPVAAFVELFARAGVVISEAEARGPMGLHKLDHVWAILSSPAVSERWRQVHGQAPAQEDLRQLYSGFAALQFEVLKNHLDLLPGIASLAEELRRRQIPFANTTGFEKAMMTDLIPAAAQQGYIPDVWVCPDDVGGGRPAPWMIYHAARRMGVYPPHAVVKVGDTAADIAEARNAGAWPVAVIETGNEIGLSRTDWEALAETERRRLYTAAEARFRDLGARYVLRCAAELLPVLDEIDSRIRRGEKP